MRGLASAKSYLLEGSPAAERRIARHYSKEKDEQEKAAMEKAAKSGEQGESNFVRKKRPQPKAGSDILKVEQQSGHQHGI